MLKLTCNRCKQEVVVNPHLYDASIFVKEEPRYQTHSFNATVRSEAMCPHCGNHMYNFHKCPISTSDIVELALRREVHV